MRALSGAHCHAPIPAACLVTCSALALSMVSTGSR